MKTKAPPLLPFFRSETQARILATLFLREGGVNPLDPIQQRAQNSHGTVSLKQQGSKLLGVSESRVWAHEPYVAYFFRGQDTRLLQAVNLVMDVGWADPVNLERSERLM